MTAVSRHREGMDDARRLISLISVVVLCLLPTFAGAADALRTLPRAEECIDVARLNSVSEAERSVLRMEWRAGLARAEESRLLNEMYERIERLQKTTNDIRVLMNAIPSANERAAANNSPSGLGPSAVIPPVVALPTTRPTTTPAVVKAPTSEPAAVAKLVVEPTAVSKPAIEPAAVPSGAPVVPPTAVPNDTPPPAPKPTPPLAKMETAKPPVAVVVAETPQFGINPLSPFQLLGVGMASVALVVLWWLRRKDQVAPSATGDGRHGPAIAADGSSVHAFSGGMKSEISEAPSAPPMVSPPLPVVATPVSISMPTTPEPVPVRPADVLDADKTLIIPAYQPPPTPPPLVAIAAEIVAPEIVAAEVAPVASIETVLEYVPAAPAVPAVSVTPPPAAIPAASTAAVAKLREAEPAQSEASTLELAEMMLSMGLATGAAQKLVEHIRANPKSALAHWLKLLEIYRENGQRSNFEQAARQLQKEFNIRASDWMRGTTDRPRLEKFDRVFSQIEGLWNQPAQCIALLSGMLHDNRDGQRVGFPQEVAEEILLLIEILKEISGLPETTIQTA